MKIPKAIVTKHKIRDFKICKLFLDEEELTYKDIGSRFGITGSRVEQILSANCVLINTAKDWEKTKRKRLLKRWIKKLGDSKKDPADLLDQLRVEEEGNKIEHSGRIDTNADRHRTVIIRFGEPTSSPEPKVSVRDTPMAERSI